MNFNLFIFYTKRKRLLRLYRIHEINAAEEFQTSKRWANWILRKNKLEKLAKKLWIRDKYLVWEYLFAQDIKLENELKKFAE